jgi:dCTP deaminase
VKLRLVRTGWKLINETVSTLLHCLSCYLTMILPDFKIVRLCQEEGMVTPFDESLVNPASIDVRLGNTIMIEQASTRDMLRCDFTMYSKDLPYYLRPGQFILAETIETFNLPNDIAAQFVLKSSRAREGIQHMLAGYCDPGWYGSKLTMELKNVRQVHSIPIWPGMKIGQMVFQRMECRPNKSYAETGRYNQDQEVTASKG